MGMESQSLVTSVKARYTVDFVHFALRELEIHSLMIQLRILTMILQTLSTHHHNPRHTLVSYVEMIITTQAKENLMKSIQTFFKKFDYISFGERPMALLLAHKRFSEIKQAFREKQHQQENIQELLRKLLNDLKFLNGILPERGEHATQISTPNWKCPVFYVDDDDDEYSIQYREYLENSSNAIAPEEPDNSLSIGVEHLDTIPETKSDEVIYSSVEDLVPIPSESEDTSRSDSECVLPSDVNSLFDEVLKDIEYKDSYDSNLDESTFLVTPLSDSNEDEYFTPGDDVELLLHRDPSTPMMSVVSILEGFTDEPPLEENDDLFI
uniref:Uncharacterized protein n=1 Tax=Tanacetum cinerariifolium TaxID=118510 RepID=A0A6L2K1Q1_TANCI|nr:hypothetical protein [Tanacetum cinerariifolium]